MRNYVIINGVNSNTINGLAINELPPITKPPMRVLQEEIDGRDGDITTNLGYGAYDKVMTIGLFHTFDINQIIAFFNGSGTIVFSNEPDKKYNYKIIDQIDYEKLISFKTATVTFHCQPFKYPVEETPLIIEPTIVTLENVTSASIETNDSTLSTTLKGNTSQYTTTGANVLESIATSNTTNIYEDVLWAEGLQANTTYTFQFVGVVGNRISGNANLFTTDTYHNITSGINTMTLTTKSDISTSTGSQYTSGKGWRIFKNAKSDNVVNVFTDVMANVGSTALPYEPYTGKNPAPNPSYPQPVNVVTGDNNIVICGKNLANIEDIKIGKTWSNTDNTQRATILYIPVEIGGTCTLVYSYTNSHITQIRGVLNKGPDDTYTSSIVDGTFTVPSGWTYISIEVLADTTFTSDMLNGLKIMLCKGSATIDDYTPYTDQTYPIYLPVENLYTYGDLSLSSTYYFVSKHLLNNFENGATYTLDFDIEASQTPFNVSIGYGSADFQADGPTLGTQTNGHITFTFTAYTQFYDSNNYKNLYIRIPRYSTSGTSWTASVTNIKLGKGKATNIGGETIELCKIGDYQDYIYKDNGSWYIHKEIGKVILDGSENWYIGPGANTRSTYSLATFTDRMTSNLENNFYSDNFCYKGNAQNLDLGYAMSFNTSIYSKYLYIQLPLDVVAYDHVADFKTWLSNHNTEVYYVLATPTNTIITDTELIGQLESLMSATTYYGITNINQQNNDLPFIMDLSYMEKDTDKVIVDNIGNIYSKPTIALEGNGTGGIYLNDNQILSVELTDKMTISISDMEAFDPDTHALLNRDVTGNYNSMTLQPNENTIKITGGITKATITDYTRWL